MVAMESKYITTFWYFTLFCFLNLKVWDVHYRRTRTHRRNVFKMRIFSLRWNKANHASVFCDCVFNSSLTHRSKYCKTYVTWNPLRKINSQMHKIPFKICDAIIFKLTKLYQDDFVADIHYSSLFLCITPCISMPQFIYPFKY